MQQAIDFAKTVNPIWPFATLIVDSDDNIICKTANCAHISSLFHAEALALHLLVTLRSKKNLGELRLFTTCEPDALSQSAIYWTVINHDLVIKQINFGTRLPTLQKLWPCGIDITAQEIIERSINLKIELVGPLLEEQCNNLFLEAKRKQQAINDEHLARKVLSHNVQDFYQILC